MMGFALDFANDFDGLLLAKASSNGNFEVLCGKITVLVEAQSITNYGVGKGVGGTRQFVPSLRSNRCV